MAGSIRVRAAQAADAARIQEIYNHYIRNTTVTFLRFEKSREDVDAIIAGGDIWVGEHAGEVQGFARYFPFRSGEGYAYSKEHTILCAPDATGTGLGRALMEVLLADARSKGIHNMIAGVSGENTAGIAFHARMGFDRVVQMDQLGRKFDRWLDLVLMQKILDTTHD